MSDILNFFNYQPIPDVAELGNPTDRVVTVKIVALGQSVDVRVGNTANLTYKGVVKEAFRLKGLDPNVNNVNITTNIDPNPTRLSNTSLPDTVELINVGVGEAKGN